MCVGCSLDSVSNRKILFYFLVIKKKGDKFVSRFAFIEKSTFDSVSYCSSTVIVDILVVCNISWRLFVRPTFQNRIKQVDLMDLHNNSLSLLLFNKRRKKIDEFRQNQRFLFGFLLSKKSQFRPSRCCCTFVNFSISRRIYPLYTIFHRNSLDVKHCEWFWSQRHQTIFHKQWHCRPQKIRLRLIFKKYFRSILPIFRKSAPHLVSFILCYAYFLPHFFSSSFYYHLKPFFGMRLVL